MKKQVKKQVKGSEQVDKMFDIAGRQFDVATDLLESLLCRGKRKKGSYRALDNLNEEQLQQRRKRAARLKEGEIGELLDVSNIDRLSQTRILQSPTRDPRRNGMK